MKYDELDLMELFLSEGISMTGNIEDGQLMYRLNKDKLTLILFVYTYEKIVNIFLQEGDKDIFSVTLNNVTALKKEDMYLKVFKEENEAAKLYFGSTLSVSVEC